MKASRYAGWIGFSIIVLAYAAVSFGVLAGTSMVMALANALGAALLGIASYRSRAWQPLTIYVVWTVIALASLL